MVNYKILLSGYDTENENEVSFAKKAKVMDETTKRILSEEKERTDYAINFRLAFAFFYRLLYMGLGFREKE
jgi:hypothetical protein